jgi:hypothetical protein
MLCLNYMMWIGFEGDWSVRGHTLEFRMTVLGAGQARFNSVLCRELEEAYAVHVWFSALGDR